jgi:hypothetical protein
MFDSLFNQLGVVWTAATVGTLLLPVALLLGWQTARAALATPTGQKFRHALQRAFPPRAVHALREAKALPAAAGHSRCPTSRRRD